METRGISLLSDIYGIPLTADWLVAKCYYLEADNEEPKKVKMTDANGVVINVANKNLLPLLEERLVPRRSFKIVSFICLFNWKTGVGFNIQLLSFLDAENKALRVFGSHELPSIAEGVKWNE
jgi:hypothetical protein